MTAPAPTIQTTQKPPQKKRKARTPEMAKGQTVNYGQQLKCTASDGSVRICMNSNAYAQTPALAESWPEASANNQKKTLSAEEARRFVRDHRDQFVIVFQNLAKEGGGCSQCVCQAHRSGFIPHISLLDHFNQKGRQQIAQAVSRQLKIICPRSNPVSQRDACARSGSFPCLAHYQPT